MGLWDSVKRQLRSVIEWETPDPDELFELWSANGDEIKNASKLLVKPGQGVIFVYEGKVQAIHTAEGLYELKTANIPFLTTLSKYMQAFESEHKVGIYFFWQTQFLNQKWGTQSMIKYVDPVYKFPVGLKTFGNFSFQLTKPEFFFASVVGSRPVFTISEVRSVITERFIQPMTDLLAKASYGFTEIDKHREELASAISDKLRPEFDKLGFLMSDFRIEGTDFDEGTKTRIGKIADTIAEAEAAKAAGINYVEMQQLQALRDAAKNQGGAAGVGIGLGAGVGLGQAFASGMAGMGMPGGAGQGAGNQAERLKQLKEMADSKLITQEEFEKKKSEILSKL